MPEPLVAGLPLYTAEQTAALDAAAIAGGTPGFALMHQAGRSCFRALHRHWPQVRSLSVFCGPGNNGGDGLVIAGLAREQGWQVEVRVLGGQATLDRVRGEAAEALAWARERGVVVEPWDPDTPPRGELLVDALLGTGLRHQVRDEARRVIDCINQCSRPVVAVDLPSGLCADTGRVLGAAVRADLCVTLIGVKRGLLTAEGPEHCGQLVYDSLNLPDNLHARVAAEVHLLGAADLERKLPRRRRHCHKGDCGHLLVVGGDQGMGGAPLMAAEAALRSGAGMVSVATRPEHVPAMLARRPELMVRGLNSVPALEPLLDRATVIVLGPGLGRSAWSEQMLHRAQQRQCPLVLDADALNLLCHGEVIRPRQRPDWVLTPHPGEAARLLGWTTVEVQENRFAAVKALQKTFGGVVVLKGPGTLVASDQLPEDSPSPGSDLADSRTDSAGRQQLWLCAAGNPGMASGGMGDSLSGVIGGLLAQGLEPGDAAAVGVWAHARAADLAAADSGERGLLASDLLSRLRPLLNGLSLDATKA